MIVLSIDFGLEGSYIVQIKVVLSQQAPNCHIGAMLGNYMAT